MEKHYVVIYEWVNVDVGDYDIDIRAVCHSYDEARSVFIGACNEARQVVEEDAEDFTIFKYSKDDFVAGVYGTYTGNHIRVYIQEV